MEFGSTHRERWAATEGGEDIRKQKTMCDVCENWARDGRDSFRVNMKLILLPDHHPNCPHYNDSLIDVWKQHPGGNAKLVAYTDFQPEPEFGMVTEKIKLHREVFENIPEFKGF